MFRIQTFGVTCLVAALIATIPAAGGQRVEVSYAPDPPRLSLGQPVVVTFEIRNNSSAVVYADLGNHYRNFEFTVVHPDGTKGHFRPPLQEGFVKSGGMIMLKSGETDTEHLLVSQWANFGAAGKYHIRISLLGRITDDSGAAIQANSGADLAIEIGPRNEKQLRDTCDELLKRILSARSYDEAEEAATVLAWVEDPVAVPYLWTPTPWPLESIMIRGLGRIGDDSAVEALIGLLNSPKRDSAAVARSVLAELENRAHDSATRERIRRALESGGSGSD